MSDSYSYSIPSVKELLEAGVHFGHECKRWNPLMQDFIYTKRGKFHIIDVVKTRENLEKATKFLKESAEAGKVILFVATKRQIQDIVKEQAIRSGSPFVVNRWLGGQFTNFDTIKKSILKLRDLENKLLGDISSYSQQTLSNMRREWARLDRMYQGVKSLDKIPSIVIIFDLHAERIAVKEAKKMGVTIVGIVDTNSNPNLADFPIPANDDAMKSVALISKCLADAIIAGNKGRGIKHEFYDFSKVGIKGFDKIEHKKSEIQTERKKIEDDAKTETKKREIKFSRKEIEKKNKKEKKSVEKKKINDEGKKSKVVKKRAKSSKKLEKKNEKLKK